MNNTNDRSLSVIVPVYNSSEYLKECIESIINSNIEGMEIILVDDGSKDDSYEICRQLAQVDDRIIVYQKENGGSASARNYGLMRATGSYIAFFDSDDTASSAAYKEAFDETVNKNYDVGCFNMIIGQEIITCNPSLCIWKQFIESPIYMHSLCNKFIKRTVIDELRMDEDLIVCEDMLFCAKIFIRSNSIGYISSDAYLYRMVSDSVTHATDCYKKSNDDMESARRLELYYDDSDNDVDFQDFVNYRYQIAALRFLLEPDVFSISEYKKRIRNKDAFRLLNNKTHRFLCRCANNDIGIIPNIYIYLKRLKQVVTR